MSNVRIIYSINFVCYWNIDVLCFYQTCLMQIKINYMVYVFFLTKYDIDATLNVIGKQHRKEVGPVTTKMHILIDCVYCAMQFGKLEFYNPFLYV